MKKIIEMILVAIIFNFIIISNVFANSSLDNTTYNEINDEINKVIEKQKIENSVNDIEIDLLNNEKAEEIKKIEDTIELVQINRVWRVKINGTVDYDYNGLATNENGTYYVKDGTIKFDYYGTIFEENKAYILEKSKVQVVCEKDTTKVMQINKIWRMVKNGKVDYNYTGIGTNENGTWYLENGKVTFGYYGICHLEDGDYIVEKSRVQTERTDIIKVNGIWRMIINGKVDYNYTGLGTNENGTYYIKNGTINFDYYGTIFEGNKAYILEKSKVQVVCKEDTTEVMQINKIWRMVVDGKVDYNYTGLGTNENGTWYLENGKVTFGYYGICHLEDGDYVVEKSKVQTDRTEVMKINGIWRMVINGKINYNYTGLGTNENGTYYIKDGTINFDYYGTYYEGDRAYIIEKNKVKADFPKTGSEVVQIDGIWRMVKNGKVDYNYTGIGTNSNGTWYLENGKVTFRYYGVCHLEDGDYVVEKSRVQTDRTEVMQVNGIWRMVINGKLNYNYNGLGTNSFGTWYVKDGTINFNYRDTYFEGDKAYIIEGNRVRLICTRNTVGVRLINETWRMVVDGKVDYNYKGLGTHENGTVYYFENGKINFNYSGEFKDSEGSIYYILNGALKEVIKNAKYPGTMWIDEPINNNKYLSGTLNVSGWTLAEEKNDIIKIYLDDKFVANASRRERPDVFEVYSNNEYGGKDSTPKPGFYCSVNTSGLSRGNHTVKIVNYASDGKTVIQSRKINFAITDLTKTWGIDVSQYQGTVNWNAVKNRGVDFAILRIGYYLESQGRVVIDPYFETYYNECKRLGIAVGGYFYSYAFNSSEASREASACISAIRGKHFEMPIFLDVEDKILKNGVANGKTNRNELTNASITFCDALNRVGYRSGVYASKNFFRDYLNVSVLERYNIWLAHYTTATDYTGKYDIWQYTSSGSVPGINGNVDLNWCFTRYY